MLKRQKVQKNKISKMDIFNFFRKKNKIKNNFFYQKIKLNQNMK